MTATATRRSRFTAVGLVRGDSLLAVMEHIVVRFPSVVMLAIDVPTDTDKTLAVLAYL